MTLIINGETSKTCQGCRTRPAFKRILLKNGQRHWRCDVCLAKKKPSGFKRKTTDDI